MAVSLKPKQETTNTGAKSDIPAQAGYVSRKVESTASMKLKKTRRYDKLDISYFHTRRNEAVSSLPLFLPVSFSVAVLSVFSYFLACLL